VAAGDGFHAAASLKDACARCASGRLHGPDMVFAVFASSESVHPYIAWFQCAGACCAKRVAPACIVIVSPRLPCDPIAAASTPQRLSYKADSDSDTVTANIESISPPARAQYPLVITLSRTPVDRSSFTRVAPCRSGLFETRERRAQVSLRLRRRLVRLHCPLSSAKFG
jgi:hypothetical protein